MRTPVIDVNGRLTHVYKSSDAGANSRTLPSIAPSYSNGVDYSDYISNVWKNDNSAFSDEQITARKVEVMDYISGLVNDMEADPEWMPEVESAYEDEGDGYITMMSDLTDPDIAAGQCVNVSEAVHQFTRVKKYVEMTPVQGMSETHHLLNVHYANLFAEEGKPTLVVDFTYSQVDETAEFPFIATPQEWVEGIQNGLTALDERIQALRSA